MLYIETLTQDQRNSKRDRDSESLSKKLEKFIEDKKLSKIIEYSMRPIAVLSMNKPVQAFEITVRLNAYEKFKASHLDGIFIYVTDHVEQNKNLEYLVSAHTIVNNYKIKNNIELDFYGMKQILDLRPIYARLEKHVSSLVAITILCQFINNYLTDQLKKSQTDKSLLDFYYDLNSCSSVAFLRAPGQLFTKLIKTNPEMIDLLRKISLDRVFTHRQYIGPQH